MIGSFCAAHTFLFRGALFPERFIASDSVQSFRLFFLASGRLALLVFLLVNWRQRFGPFAVPTFRGVRMAISIDVYARSDPFCQIHYERIVFANVQLVIHSLNFSTKQKTTCAFGPMVEVRHDHPSFMRCVCCTFSISYLVDPASSDMLVSKIKPCMCK
jgi:hypothetical protein